MKHDRHDGHCIVPGADWPSGNSGKCQRGQTILFNVGRSDFFKYINKIVFTGQQRIGWVFIACTISQCCNNNNINNNKC